MPNSKTYIVNDQPTDKDALDFTPYVETLADIIQTGNTPLTIGVFGTWGSGKTSLMKMVKKLLPDDFTISWFDAWKYDKEETLWRAFLLCVLSSVIETAQKQGKPTDEFKKMQSLLYREMELEKLGGVIVDLPKLGGAVATGLVKLSLSFIPGITTLTKLIEELQSGAAMSVTDDAVAAITRERTKIYIEQVQFLEQFQEKFSKLVKTHIAPKRLVVFIDDLDRCLPEKAIEVLEAIKLFLDVENCIFVLGLDQEVIARGIEMKYKELGSKQDSYNTQSFTVEGVRYLEKIVQLPFQIPLVEQTDMDNFVRALNSEWPHEECSNVFAKGLNDIQNNNPRQIKRAVNVFLMLWNLASKRREKLGDRVKAIRLAKIVAIQIVHPKLYDELKDTPRYLRDLEEYYRSESEHEERVANGDLSRSDVIEEEDSARLEPPPILVPLLSLRGIAAVRRILLLHKPELQDANFVGLPIEDLKLYFTLTARAESPQVMPTANAALSVFEPQMIKIPAGKFLIGTTKEQAQEILKHNNSSNWQQMLEWEQPQHIVELDQYFISKYPITNREYQAFIKDNKYKSPAKWDGDQFSSEESGHPVVNVSWTDATEYCKWLSMRTQRQYRLPTEAEWEKSARWDTSEGKSLIYPWGNDFDPKKANSIEINSGSTSEVGQFSPQGDSPYGCVDMGGNVWEWCNDWFNEQEYKQHKDGEKNPQGIQIGSSRILRGGSWGNDRWPIRCARRNMNPPGSFSDYIGFRVVYS